MCWHERLHVDRRFHHATWRAPSVVLACPHYETIPRAQSAFYSNITVSGGPAPVRAYIDELLPDVLSGAIQPGRVFDSIIGLEEVPAGYVAMQERKRIKVMIKP
jgi:threonine dehydrogenase-like Zn-dependent dehydrogenase